MLNSLLLCLALVLVLSGVVLLSYVDRGITAQKRGEIKMTVNSTYSESADSSVVEVDGVSFETLVSDSVLPIPENKPSAKTPVKFGIRITNKTNRSIRFCSFDTIFPDLIEANGMHLQRKGGRNRSRFVRESDCPLTNSEESVTFFLDGALAWQNDKLQLGGSDGFGGLWYFDDLKPEKYGFSFRYYSSQGTRQISYPQKKVLENIWVGEVVTPITEVSLAEGVTTRL